MRQALLILLGSMILVFFQNCSDVQFAELNKQSKLVGVMDFNDDGLGDGVIGDGLIPESMPDSMPASETSVDPVAELPVEKEPEVPVEEETEVPVVKELETPVVDSVAGEKCDKGNSCKDKGNGNDLNINNDALSYVCILAGPGKSNRLGINDRILMENNRTPQTVCTSIAGCNEIASKAFEIKSVEQRGYCMSRKGESQAPHNKHVRRVSEEALSLLVQNILDQQ